MPKKTKPTVIDLWAYALHTRNKELKEFLENNADKEVSQKIEVLIE